MKFILKKNNALAQGFLTYGSLCHSLWVTTKLFNKVIIPLTQAISTDVTSGNMLSQHPICVLISGSHHMYATQGDLVHRKIIHALHQGLLAQQWVMCTHCNRVSPSTYHCCWHTKADRGP